MWDQRYGEPGFAYGVAPNDFLAEVADRLTPGHALCLAEGEGRNAVFLAERGHVVTAVDLSAKGLEKTHSLATSRGVRVTTVHADLADFDAGVSCWQTVVAIWAHVQHDVRGRMHRAIAHALVPGGLYVAEAYTPAQLQHGTGGPRTVDLVWDLASVQEELTGLELIVGREVERQIHEGRYHEGLSATVQILARRPL